MLFGLERIEKYVHNKEKYNSFEDLNNISSSNVIVVFMLFHMALRFHAVFYTKTYTQFSGIFSWN